jgi:hypothetical protein
MRTWAGQNRWWKGTRRIIHRARSKKQGLKNNAAQALLPGPHAI